jgi:hypothetical protein
MVFLRSTIRKRYAEHTLGYGRGRRAAVPKQYVSLLLNSFVVVSSLSLSLSISISLSLLVPSSVEEGSSLERAQEALERASLYVVALAVVSRLPLLHGLREPNLPPQCLPCSKTTSQHHLLKLNKYDFS